MIPGTSRCAAISASHIRRRDRWVYSAGFNVLPGLKYTKRIDVELEDLRMLADCGARVAVLAHQGSWTDHSATHLNNVADYISEKLGSRVEYYPENDTEAAVARSHLTRPGQIVVFGNTRFHEGEQSGCLGLASRFSRLGDRAAIGGACKAHRAHASNVGILDFLPGWATAGLAREFSSIDAICESTARRIALLGGFKKEKVLFGLPACARSCEAIIPGGIVLNALLAASDVDIGDSALGEQPQKVIAAARQILTNPHRAEILMPEQVLTAERRGEGGYSPSRGQGLMAATPDKYMIVDHVINGRVRALLDARRGPVQLLIAGTPSLVTAGFRLSTDAWRELARQSHIIPIVVGGDTAADIQLPEVALSGGGSVLEYMCTGTCAVLDALVRNQPLRDQAESIA